MISNDIIPIKPLELVDIRTLQYPAILITLWCHQTWLAEKYTKQLAFKWENNLEIWEISSKPCLTAGW